MVLRRTSELARISGPVGLGTNLSAKRLYLWSREKISEVVGMLSIRN
jgi:hypothetical protein